jgi:predicted 2-oxoglutarate/Fe(II)-dependent dioxygenase YbiX
MLRLDREARLVSIVILLSRQTAAPQADSFCGGSLVLYHRRTYVRSSLSLELGTLVAFPSETTHEVTPVTDGERYSIACWYR